MKKLLLGLLTLLLNLSAFAQENQSVEKLIHIITNPIIEDSAAIKKQTDTTSIDYKINKAITPVTDWIEGVVFYSVSFNKSENQPKIVIKKEDNESNDTEVINFDLINNNDLKSTMSGTISNNKLLHLKIDNYNPNSVYVWTFKDKNEQFDITLFKIKGKNAYVKFDGKLLTNNVTIHLVEYTSSLPFILVWLIVASIFFTVSLKFINIRGIKYFPKIVKGAYTKPEDKGEVTHFQALTAALSGTVGLGNIAGVAVAIAAGGPGATFWMIVAGLLGMSAKFVECTLGVKYREVRENGSISGGPMYYLTKGLAEKNKGNLGKVLAVIFAIACIGGSFGGGNMFQVNQAYEQFVNLPWLKGGFFTENAWVFGVIMASVVGIVIIGGIKSIAKVTDKIVPFMCGIYVLAAIVIILDNYSSIPTAFGLIISGAFAPKAIAGGIIGVMIQGFKRAAFSNEAGIGSASIAHSAVKTGEPVTEGFVALLEPFIDTVVVCTMTALVLVITGYYDNTSLEGIKLTSAAFSSHFSWFKPVLALAVILFAFSTMVSWSYYGLKAWTYLFGETKISEISYKIVFCIFIVIGASMSLGKVIGFSDSMIFLMSIPNIIGLYILSSDVRKDLATFIKKVKSGELKEVEKD